MVKLAKDSLPPELFQIADFFDALWKVDENTIDAVYANLCDLRKKNLIYDSQIVNALNLMAGRLYKKIKLISTIAERLINDFKIDYDRIYVQSKNEILYSILMHKNLINYIIPQNLRMRSLQDLYNYFPVNSFEYAILHDDIGRFKDYASRSNFDVNMKLNDRDTLLDFAVSVGALQIFNYLFNNGADITEYTVCQSYCGGNMEIINFFEHSCKPILRSINNACIYHNEKLIKHLADRYNYKTDFSICVQYFNINHLISMITSLDDINQQDINGETVLFAGVKRDLFYLNKCLMENGINIDIKNKNNLTALDFIAICPNSLSLFVDKIPFNNLFDVEILKNIIEFDNVELLKLLVEKGCKLDNSLVLTAALSGSYEIMKILLENHCDVNYPVNDTYPICAIPDDPELLKLMIKYGADVNLKSAKFSPISTHMIYSHYKVVNILADYIDDANQVNSLGISLLMDAVTVSTELVNKLLKMGADVHYKNTKMQGFTAIHVCAMSEQQNTEIMDILIDHGLSVNERDSEGNTPFHYSVAFGKLKMSQYLIEKNSDVNAVNNAGQTPLNYICTETEEYQKIIALDNPNIVKFLVEKNKCDKELPDNKGMTPLMNCANTNRLESFKVLLENKCDVEKFSKDDETVLMICSRLNNIDFINIMKDMKVLNLNTQNTKGQTCLHISCINNHQQTIMKLIQLGADFNLVDSNGQSLFHLACYYNMKEIVSYLIKNGALFNVRDKNNKSPFLIALERNNKEICMQLIKTNKCVFYDIDLLAVFKKPNQVMIKALHTYYRKEMEIIVHKILFE
ncbi:hypothetical protein TVAG_164610 [Trichomonas vaginalis G3]|uniref:DUF3447 domain-containing protein n=1 Tax=Trichomonas vaginalis (strain ATCC PRA-98 / G3) TaxID=412133 RepID=A2E202_TRIV3|nr:spectrin binding [Trichomonas vaginalis G3]EAY13351.1 hypothetical protein TVAG_164610 [Trichomonas vaginalis G3]KAI5540380.1 spectrin binding [Trichomonas vaginalis G3]|eukprot:XP_001325574.1 hypothetical protein [Trichomonas vaginalis G3]